MKRISKLILSFLIIAIGAFNFLSLDVNKYSNVSLDNVKALQASAGEAYCDQSDDTVCKIRVGDVSGYSTGSVRGSH